MDEEQPGYIKAALQSSTIRWVLAAGITHLCKTFGLEMLPDAVSSEVIHAIIMGLDVVIPAMLAMAIRGRMRARTFISGWFK